MDNQTVSDSLLKKIQALLRMAEHPNSNQFEASMAAEKASELLREHNLTRQSVLADGTKEFRDEAVGMIDLQQGQAFPWKSALLSAIAKPNLCTIVVASQSKLSHLIGTETNVRVVAEIYFWVAEQLEQMGKRDYKIYKADEGTEARTRWMNSFYFAAIEVIKSRLGKPFEDFKQGTGRELVVFNGQALKVAQDKAFPSLGTYRRNVAVGRDGGSYGTAAGSSVSFSRPGAIGSPHALGSGR